MDRITDADLNRRIDTVNSLLGFEDPRYPTPGTVVLYSAYGSTAVHMVMSPEGGQSELHSLGTKREAFLFLNGLIKGLDMARKNGLG